MSENIVIRIVAAVTSAVIAECTQHTFNASKDHINTFAEKVSAKVAVECQSEVAEDEEPTPIQVFRDELSAIVEELKKEVLAEVRESVKMEMRMEMYTEMEALREKIDKLQSVSSVQSQLNQQPQSVQSPQSVQPTQKSVQSTASSGKLTGLKLLGSAGNSANTPAPPTCLDDNPLFKLVNKNLERSKAGKAMYTTEEFIAAHGDRFDDEVRAQIRDTGSKYREEYDDDSDDDEVWAKMQKTMKDRLL